MAKITLTTSRGYMEALSNLCSTPKTSVEDIKDAIESASSAEEMLKNIESLNLLRKFNLDKETEAYIRFKGSDCFGNTSYLKITKDKPETNATTTYLNAWLKKNHKKIIDSDWFVENEFNENELSPELFMEFYIVPLIESNIEYDFNTNINGEKFVK